MRMMSFFCAAVMMFSALSAFSALSFTAAGKQLSQEDFVHTEGQAVVGTDGRELLIRGISLGNSVYGNPKEPNCSHHDEDTYRELSELGFNCVRFYLNYGLFEDDEKPYSYKKEGFQWLDRNVKWAKKYGMGIIFNMHFPQGGYQSAGNGMALWTEKENGDRLCALWQAIAERYAHEPAVWGYALINEPFVPYLGEDEATIRQVKSLMDRITASIRKVSPYQMIFAETGIMTKDAQTGERIMPKRAAEGLLFTLEDDNVVYEFHNYNPFHFTHQDADWAGTEGIVTEYPSHRIAAADYESYWVGCVRGTVKESGTWTRFETAPVTLSEGSNIGYAAVNAARLGERGTAYFDDITVTETAPDGSTRILYSYDFEESVSDFYMWSEDGTGSIALSDEGRNGGSCMKITGSLSDLTASADHFELREGHSYTVSGYIRSTVQTPVIRMDLAKASGILTADREFLESTFRPYAEFSEKHDVPVYLGEFGVIAAGFQEGRGGERWVSDMLDICYSLGIGFNYHCYHEGGFGLYQSYDYILPREQDRNKALFGVFSEKLRRNTAAYGVRLMLERLFGGHDG